MMEATAMDWRQGWTNKIVIDLYLGARARPFTPCVFTGVCHIGIATQTINNNISP